MLCPSNTTFPLQSETARMGRRQVKKKKKVGMLNYPNTLITLKRHVVVQTSFVCMRWVPDERGTTDLCAGVTVVYHLD